jgi:menaquinone-specific isochorismate synthase
VLPPDVELLAIREPLTTSLRRGTPLVWASGDGRERRALLGWGERFRAAARGPQRFAQLSAAFREHVEATRRDGGAAPLAFVTVTFAADSAVDSVLVVPEVVGRWHLGQLEIPAAGEVPEPSEPAEFEELDFRAGSLTREQYRRAVARAVGLIEGGEVEKIVVARDLEAVATHPIDLSAVLARLQYANPESWTFHVDGMFGSSPELLAAVHGRSVHSRVLAGSAPVTGRPDADAAAAAGLLASGKDRIEHEFAARSVAERLGRVAEVMTSEAEVLRLPTIMHLATELTGTLARDLSALDVAALVHPSAAVCGTPSDRAAELITELEGLDRGRYAGPVGWVDADGNGQFAIALRSGQLAADRCSVRLFAGGGIVDGSVPNEELAETAQKFLPMYQALSPVARP